MSLFGRKKVVVTHNGSFHTDDVFAVATISIFNKGKIKIIRSRDPAKISAADFIVDVGGVYEPTLGKFDHHQPGGGGKRENGVPYAAFGLVWKSYGEKICGSKEVADDLTNRLVLPIDAADNGEGQLGEIMAGVWPYTINEIVDALNLAYGERGSDSHDKAFAAAVEIAVLILQREIVWAKDRLSAEKIVEHGFEEAEDKRIIVVEPDCSCEEAIAKYKEPLFVIHQYPDGDWAARAVKAKPRQFESRILFPESWAGKRNEALQKESGISDAIFCHNKRFLAIAKSKEGAISLAKKALNGEGRKLRSL